MNKALIFIGIILTFFFTSSNYSQTIPTSNDDDVVKIDSSIVQLDAVVTDKDGTPVTNLSKDDFEIWQDGKLKRISNFNFVDTTVSRSASPKKPIDKNAPIPPIRDGRNSTGRVITFLIDDGNCTASLKGMKAAKDALIKFVNEQMYPNDLVAIYKTRSGSALLQQYTSDKSKLLAIAGKIRWYPTLGCDGSGSFFKDARQFENIVVEQPQNDEVTDDTQISMEERNRAQKENIDSNNSSNQIAGVLGVIRYIVKGLDDVAGRKVVFIMSDGFPSLSEGDKSDRVRNALRSLTEQANRSSVVLNTIDVRGVVSADMITAADDIKLTKDFAVDKSSSADVSEGRREQYRSSQEGLAFLADETGGDFYRGSNYLDKLLLRAMNIEKGYYLLGYEPDDETFKGTKFHNIQIKLKREDLKVYSRSGFVGRQDQKKPTAVNAKSELYKSIVAPLPQAGIELRLTAFYANSETEGDFIRTMVHIDGKDIEFVDDKNGNVKAVFDVVAVTLNEKDDIVDEFNRTHTIMIDKRAIPMIRATGLAYSTDVKVKKSGVYNFRVGMLDTNSKLVGSATQSVDIPNLKKDRIFLSGLTLGATDASGRYTPPSRRDVDSAISLVASEGEPEIRTFRRGTKVGYSYTIYNAKIDPTTDEPKIAVILNLYKDGEMLVKGEPRIEDFGIFRDRTRIRKLGYIQLRQNYGFGNYALQIIVKDMETNQTSSSWVDFEIVD